MCNNRSLENFHGADRSNTIQDKIIADKAKTCLKLEKISVLIPFLYFTADFF